jgi:hypothetical protein
VRKYSASTAQVKQAITKLVDSAVASGDIRLDLDPLDLLRVGRRENVLIDGAAISSNCS